MCLSGYAILLSLRFNLSVAIIEMTAKSSAETIQFECNKSIVQGLKIDINCPNKSVTLERNNQELIYHFYALRDMQFFMQLVLTYLLALSAWLKQMLQTQI